MWITRIAPLVGKRLDFMEFIINHSLGYEFGASFLEPQLASSHFSPYLRFVVVWLKLYNVCINPIGPYVAEWLVFWFPCSSEF